MLKIKANYHTILGCWTWFKSIHWTSDLFDVFNYLNLLNDMNSLKAVLLGKGVKLLELIKPKLEFTQNDFNVNVAAIHNLNEELNLDVDEKCFDIFENLNRMLKEQNQDYFV